MITRIVYHSVGCIESTDWQENAETNRYTCRSLNRIF